MAEKTNFVVTRRNMLRKAGLAIGGVTILADGFVQPASAAKLSQAAAGYQAKPNGDKACFNCALFQTPSSCQLVDGKIMPTGYCKLWAKKG